MENVLIALIVAAILGGVIWYLHRAKKQGKTCIGCPYCKQCSGKCMEHRPAYGYSNSKEARLEEKENSTRPFTRKE